MPLYDERCDSCGHTAERRRAWRDQLLPCDDCGGICTVVWLTTPKFNEDRDVYDMLDGPLPDSRPIKSFAHDRRKGGKDVSGQRGT